MKLPELTEEQKELKVEIERLEKLKRNIQEKLNRAKYYCSKIGHVVVPRNLNIDEELKTDIWACTGAYCLVCGNLGGLGVITWWCPKSPDHLCHYTGTNEFCDYCGMPDERK